MTDRAPDAAASAGSEAASAAGASEGARLHALQTMAEAAAASDTAAIVLDDIERLLGHVLLSHHPAAGGMQETVEAAGAMSPAMLEALLALLRRPPPRGRSLVIIGTTAHYPLIARTSLLHAFDARVELPPLEHPAGVYELLRLAGATPARACAERMRVAARRTRRAAGCGRARAVPRECREIDSLAVQGGADARVRGMRREKACV